MLIEAYLNIKWKEVIEMVLLKATVAVADIFSFSYEKNFSFSHTAYTLNQTMYMFSQELEHCLPQQSSSFVVA